MTRGRGLVVASVLFLVTLAAAGCGLGPGAGLADVQLTVTHDFGSEPVVEKTVKDVTESDTVMRVLERSATIITRYGGGFVQSIEGVEGEAREGGSYDWFFYVNGIESAVGAADYALHGGERIWWDYRDWSAAMRVPAVVGSWPEPMLDGYDGHSHPVAVQCMGGGRACTTTKERLAAAGVELAAQPVGSAIRFLVGPWARVRSDPAAAQIEAGPQTSGVFADFRPARGGFELEALDQQGMAVGAFGPDAGLVAATSRNEEPPVWVVTGTSLAGTRSAAELLDRADLRDHYAVATDGAGPEALPKQ